MDRFYKIVESRLAMDKDAFSDKIVSKAAEIFNYFGYKKTTMDEIARQLGKGKSSIYYYFSSKEEIFQAVVRKEANVLEKQVRMAINDASEPIDKFRNYVITRVKVFKYIRNFYTALNSDGLLHLDFVNSMRKKYEQSEIELVKTLLDAGVESNEFNIKNTKLGAIAMVTALKGLEDSFYEKENDKELNDQLDSLLHILFYGISKR